MPLKSPTLSVERILDIPSKDNLSSLCISVTREGFLNRDPFAPVSKMVRLYGVRDEFFHQIFFNIFL
jgi:hypothetical protein